MIDDDENIEYGPGYYIDYNRSDAYGNPLIVYTKKDKPLSVTEFIEECNDYLEANFEDVLIEGEVAEFKVNQGKWVFFSLKDEQSTVSCFMSAWQLSIPLEDGMKVRLSGTPKLTKWGKFSLTVKKISPVGEGSIKKAFEMLKKKLAKEGLFDESRKRPLPKYPTKIGVISSTSAAGYADFCKIVNSRWGGLEIKTAHTQVQGLDAPAQIIRALEYLNEQAEVEVIAILRGGGSKDDLSCFNDETLARALARSRIPVITGIGHEVDESIADLVADARASTPSNCAELLTRDRRREIAVTEQKRLHARSRLLSAMTAIYHNTNTAVSTIKNTLNHQIASYESLTHGSLYRINARLKSCIAEYENIPRARLRDLRHVLVGAYHQASDRLSALRRVLESCNPDKVLSQGYAILSGKISPGETLNITTSSDLINTKIVSIKPRKKTN